jgi:hypothetical protein
MRSFAKFVIAVGFSIASASMVAAGATDLESTGACECEHRDTSAIYSHGACASVPECEPEETRQCVNGDMQPCSQECPFVSPCS